MKRGRPAEGPSVVDGLEGSEAAKSKLRAILESMRGEKSVEEICAELGIGKTAFYELRTRILEAALAEGEPKPAGRPPHLPPDTRETELARLRDEVKWLRLQMRIAHVREEIMLGMPEVFEPLKRAGKKNTRPDKGKNG